MGMIISLTVLIFFVAQAGAVSGLLVFRPKGEDFTQVAREIQLEIGDEYSIHQITLAPDAKVEEMSIPLRQFSPQMVILMDNRVIHLYKRHLINTHDSGPAQPSLSLMAASVEHEIAGLAHATAIGYEIPIVTSAVNLRTIMSRPLPSLGVLHREFLASFVAENTEYCRREGIRVASVSLKNKDDDLRKSLRKGLIYLFEKEKIEALWVPNDNTLLKSDLLRDIWIPLIQKYRKPVIVGVEALVRPALHFGTFAVLPDHSELGHQAADMVLETTHNQDTPWMGKAIQPLSVIKVVNLIQAHEFLGLERDQLKNVDHILE